MPTQREIWRSATYTCGQCGSVVTRADKPGIIYSAFLALRFCSPECAHASLRADPVASFWAKIEKTRTCWLWTGGLSPKGYGVHWIGRGYKRAHRYSYQLATGIDPGRYVVMHSCDNRRCVNPEHLSLGSQTENIADMDRKGRRNAPRGTSHGCAALTESQVRAIRADPRPHAKIAGDYPVSKSGIGAIKAGRTWKHLP
jgi:hypothetical protein